jgi:hypothetical protein
MVSTLNVVEAERLVDNFGWKLKSKLEDIMRHWDLGARYETRWVYHPDLEVELMYAIGVEFYEISVSVGERVERYCVEHDLGEGDCEKAYEKALEEEFETINREYAIYVNAKVKTPTGVEINVYPKECESDYCTVGALATIKIKPNTPAHDMLLREQYHEALADAIANVVASIVELYLNTQ